MKNIHPVWKNFFVLEGLDGSGTTSQLKMLTDYGPRQGLEVFGTCEPTDHPIGQMLRQILHKDLIVEPETMARLFTADRYEHLYAASGGIQDRISREEIVISDRYLFSSLAYQSLGSDFEKILALNTFPLPEKVFYIDVPPEECLKRRSNRGIEELFDAITLQEKLRINYMNALNAFPESGMEVHILDGTKSKEEVFGELRELIFNTH